MTNEEIQAQRKTQMDLVATEFKKTSLTTGERAKAKFTEAEELRRQAKLAEDEARTVSGRFAQLMDQFCSNIRVKVPNAEGLDQEAVPWLKRASSDQLILGIGDDEYLVIDVDADKNYITHHYGKPSESGHRSCDGQGTHKPHGNVVLESYTLGVFGQVSPRP